MRPSGRELLQQQVADRTGRPVEEVQAALGDPAAIEVDQKKAGIGVIEAIVVAVGTQIAKDVWTHILFPRIRSKWGLGGKGSK